MSEGFWADRGWVDVRLEANLAMAARGEPAPASDRDSTHSESKHGHAMRGPLRPDVWITARKRNGYRLRVFYYRGLDLAVSFLVTAGWLAYPRSIAAVGQLTVLEIAPYLLGWLGGMWFLLASSSYSFVSPRGIIKHALVAGGCIIIGSLAGGITQIALDPDGTPRYLVWACGFAALIFCLHLIWAIAIRKGRLTGALTPNVALVGATDHAERMIQAALKRRDVNILGIFDDRRARRPDRVCGVPVLGETEALLSHRLTGYLDCIALTVPGEANERVRQLERRLTLMPNRVVTLIQSEAPSDEEIAHALDKMALTPVATLRHPPSRDTAAFYKRLQDIICGAAALLLLSPLMIAIAIWVRLDSKGPALFRQVRHGFNHEEIVVWKFRTMRADRADHSGVSQVTSDDDRITRAGRFLRTTSLDELPQIFNVLRGEMSLVGPRPHAIAMKTGQVMSSDIVADYAHRHRIKPGMTGWAAINGSRGPMHTAADVRRRVQLDIDYIERQSFWFDIWIMARTLPVLLGDKLAVR